MIETILGWLGLLPGPAVLGVATLALVVEAGLLAGLFVPGTSILLILGVLSQLGVTPLALAIPLAAAGTVAGAHVGFWRGRTTGLPSVRLLDRCRDLVGRHRGWAVAVGHWSSAGRTLVPRISAAGGMPYRTFALAVVPSAVAWAGAVVTLGYTQAAAYRTWSDALGVVGPVLAVLLIGALVLSARTPRRRARSPRPPRPDRSPAR
ncbi:VTT domain-containing protein [Nonomuraea sp. NPDC050310]|uniref:DedA family protein n=1 Tax=unclassified Nonomuraea TaxID=2593643 RepID=UPI0033D6A136